MRTESDLEVRLAYWELDDPLWKEEIHFEFKACTTAFLNLQKKRIYDSNIFLCGPVVEVEWECLSDMVSILDISF